MKKRVVITSCFLLLYGVLNVSCTGHKYDRQSLVLLMDQYLEALADNDPSGLPLAGNVKLVENTEKIPIGKGLWETVSSGPNDFRIYVADPVAGQVAFIGLIEVKGTPAILGARLKLSGNSITEIDHLVVYNVREEPLSKTLIKPRPGFLQPLENSERMTREQMLKAANSYYDAIVQSNGDIAPFAKECERRENGVTTVNYQQQTPEEAALDDFSVFRKMTCSDQISTGVWSNITGIEGRRFIAVDEEMGLVFAFSLLLHDGSPEVMEIRGVPGITEWPNQFDPFDTVAAHVFKMRNGLIYDIEAIGYMAEHGIETGWE